MNMDQGITIRISCCVLIVLVYVLSSEVSATTPVQTKVAPTSTQPSTTEDLAYGNWTKWTKCSKQCLQERTRKCKDPGRCFDGRTQRQERSCNFGNCRSKHRGRVRHGISRSLQDILINVLYRDWSAWSMCTRSCKQRRFRTCALRSWCNNMVIMEDRRCYHRGSNCEALWLEEQVLELEDTEYDHPPKRDRRPKPRQKARMEAVPPDPETCGLRPPGPTPRIVGGYEARKGSWPWQVAITTKRGEQYCGGVMIAPQWILTAAHCVRKNGRRRRIDARAGDHDLMAFDGTEVELDIDTDFPHPDFDAQTIDSDIALIRLRKPVNASSTIQYACIPGSQDELRTNTLCYAVGWGKVKATHRFGTDILREAPVPLVDPQKCQGAFEYDLTPSQMCAGYRRGGIDTCAGDSGGPLMCEMVRGGVSRWYVYGITSFGEGCGLKGKYGIYTKLTMFSHWIRNITHKG